MTNDLKERLLKLCNGHPNATIPWPHRVIHDTLARITELEARLAAAEALALEYEHRHQRALSLLHKAEAGEDALAQALRGFDEHIPCGVVECHGDKCRESWCASCFGWEEAEKYMSRARAFSVKATSALAAYEARREG